MELVRLRDIGKIVTGNTPPTSKPEFYGDYMPFIKATDISLDSKTTLVTEQSYSKRASEKYKESLVPKGSTCVVTIGSIGKKMTYAHKDLFVNQAINAIIPSPKYDNEYIYYNVKYSVLPQLKKLDSGTTSGRENVSKSSFSNIRIPIVKDKNIQHRIASILSTYDSLIENNTKRIRLLEKMAENLYKEWFVRFRFPGHENVEMENGLPKGWKMTNLFDVAGVTYGFAFKSNKFCDNAELNPVVRIRDIQENHTNTYTDEQCEDKYLIGKNAILIGMDGIFHMCLWNGERAYMNQRVVMLNSKEKGVCNYLLYLAIRPQIKYWEQVISGTTVAHLGDKHLRKVKVLLPEKAILEKANSIISRAMDEKNILQHQNSLLARQRDLLLPRLMSGKLEVKEELLE